jgi:predicted alpha/beta-fold hydrolase
MRYPFKPAWWLPGAHLQTLWPALFRTRPAISIKRERVELPDGDFIDLDWSGSDKQPLILLLHGLEGSLNSHYIRPLMSNLNDAGFATVFMNFRGCSGQVNRLARSYHSGDTADVAFIMEYIETRYGRAVEAAIGFSLGGNVLLKWLGQSGQNNPLKCAVAVSVPFVLDEAATRLRQGFSRLYELHLLKSLKQSYLNKFERIKSPLSVNVRALSGFREFDDQITAPLHGFNGVEHYYRESSCRQYLINIAIPTCIIHSKDDPFMYQTTIPEQDEINRNIELVITDKGGHVGFIAGEAPWKANYWHENVICDYLKQFLSGD